MLTREQQMQEAGFSETQISNVTAIFDSIDVHLDSKLNGTITLDNNHIFHMKPLSRKLGKLFQRTLKDIQKSNKTMDDVSEYDGAIEACLKYSLTDNLDLDDLQEPDYDRLVMGFNKYYTEYKKKSMTNT